MNQNGEGCTSFNDHGTLYIRSDDHNEWLFMEDVPDGLENRC